MQTKPTLLWLLLVQVMLAGGSASAQDDYFGVEDENLESSEGLENATPTDSVDELNSGNGNGAGEGNFGGEPDFPAANGNGAGNGFDLNTGNNTGNTGDDFFGDEPAGNGNPAPANQGISAFGNQGGPANQATPAKQGANPLQQAVPQQVPVQAIPQQIPAQQVPANAQSLMNQINTIPANGATGNAVPTNPGVDPATAATGEVSEATGAETLLPSNPEPAIEAPPLPPPNEFAGSPPVPGSMRILAESEAPEEYMVQPGDTLFDICDQLLDEPAYWPKLWALNPEIKNPHFIFPNMRLRFYPGDDDTPPYLQVVTEEEVIPIEKGDLDEQELIAEKVIFEEEDLGGETLNIEVIGPEDVEELTDGVLFAGRSYRADETQVQVPGFIFSEEKEPAGFVVVGREGGFNRGPLEKIVVESNGGISAGTLYSVLRPGEKVYDPESNDFLGYKYYFVGNVRIKKGLEDELYSGIMEGNRLGVQPDDIVVNYISTIRTVPLAPNVASTNSADATVVGFEFKEQVLSGNGGFAFISKGSSDGISPGMYLPIYSTPGYLTLDLGVTDLPRDPEYIGVIRIVDTTEAGAVGWIVSTAKEIRIGDRTDKG
jgi:hypothetical protein